MWVFNFANFYFVKMKVYMYILLSRTIQDDLKGIASIEGSMVIFCMATYGEGDPTDNAVELYNWLKNEDSPPDLTGLRYTVRCSACYIFREVKNT